MKRQVSGPTKITLFGHFDGTNFGNECTLQAFLYHLRRLQPDAHVSCICSGPQVTAKTYDIEALPFTHGFLKSWVPANPLTRALRKFCATLREPLEWVETIRRIRGTDILIIPGTGLLTDAYGLRNWGPYGLLRWSLSAKVCGCRLALVSVGAGPLYWMLGKWFVWIILSVADFRSYRDTATVRYLESIGLATSGAEICPDLAFSIPDCKIPRPARPPDSRLVVGLGVMEYAGKYSVPNPTDNAFTGYLQNLVETAVWLLDRGYDIRLLSGDAGDSQARHAFKQLLEERYPAYGDCRIVDEPVSSVRDLLHQIAATDFMIATRFHNLVLGFLCGKPVISLSFHHKCESLMATFGMSDYCIGMDGLTAARLIESFCRLEAKANILKPLIRERISAFRQALDLQYTQLFCTAGQKPGASSQMRWRLQ
jgi:polysaccharide pyruvyl transferase WcaK-like protein